MVLIVHGNEHVPNPFKIDLTHYNCVSWLLHPATASS